LPLPLPLHIRGRQNKIGDPRGGWVGRSEAKKGQGLKIFLIFFYDVFSPHRETPKNVIKKIKKTSVLDFWSNFW
jgi:hypothetical protein